MPQPAARIVHLPLASQPIVPWRNGGGRTREVAAEPQGARAGDAFRWRVSVAEVASDGPFSTFPEVDRTLWLLRGNGMELDIDGRQVRLEQPLASVEFPGEAKVHARLLGGPTVDLNLMLHRRLSGRDSTVQRLARGCQITRTIPWPGQDLWLVLDGTLEVTAPDTSAWTLATGDALRLDGWDAGRQWVARPIGDAVVFFATFA